MANAKYAMDDRGRVRLYVGYWVNSKDKRVQRPFFFGTEQALVPSRLARVNEVWEHEVKRWETPRQHPRRLMADPEARDGKPVWSSWGLRIAVQLAAGKTQIGVPNVHETLASVYAETLRRLSAEWPMVHFVAEDTVAAERGTAVILNARDHAVAKLSERYDLPENLLKSKSDNLHNVLTAYIKAIETENVEPTESGPQLSAWGEIRKEHAERLKLHHADQPMSALDFDGCQKLFDYWRNRPLSRKKKPMSVAYCKHHISELIRFFKWASKSKQFSWRKPEDFEELNHKVRKISSEKTDISFVRVPTHTIEELVTIYRHASDLQRLLLLLGLNCGFRGAEMGTVENKHLFLSEHPNAKYLAKYNYDIRPGDGFLLYSRLWFKRRRNS